jgi:hypothetical protein
VGDFSRPRWGYFAIRIVAVGEHNQHAVLHAGSAFKHRDGQANGIAEHRLWPGHTHLRLVQQRPAGIEVFSEWRLHKGR